MQLSACGVLELVVCDKNEKWNENNNNYFCKTAVVERKKKKKLGTKGIAFILKHTYGNYFCALPKTNQKF